MFVKKNIIVGAIALGVSSLSSLANAQIYDEFQYSHDQDLNFQSKLTLKIPLGATDHRKTSNQPRFGLNVGLARGDFGSPFGPQYGQAPLNLLDVGTYGFNRPSLQLNSQEIYGPTYIALHADETSEDADGAADEDKGPSTTLILAGGALVAVGVAAVVVNEAVAELLVECVFNPARPEDCPD